jgi:CheY-like chemotaxis protein
MSVGQVILGGDDDAHNRKSSSFALTKAGYTVIEGGGGKEALARYRDSRPR